VTGQNAAPGRYARADLTRARIMDVAEKLFAAQGVRSASLSEVGKLAGQRNRSATTYHFGSREGLIEAIFVDRMRPVNELRSSMLDRLGASPDLRSLVEALVVPIASAVSFTGSTHFAGFLEQVFADRELRRLVDRSQDVMEPTLRLYERLIAATELPPRLARRRLSFANTMMIHVLALYEDSGEGEAGVRERTLAGELVDAVVGILTAPADGKLTAWPV
jgi:AcrR family transcriptional regulator